MNLNNLIDLLERIKNSWESRKGILITILLANFLYFKFLLNPLLSLVKDNSWLLYSVAPISITILLFIIWVCHTNRFFIKKNKTFILGVFLKVDEDEAEYKIKKIVKTCTREINNEFKEMNVKVFPVNYKVDKLQIERYLKSHSNLIDAILFAHVESGKQKTENGVEDKIVITEFSFIGNFNVHENLQVFHSSVNLARDLKLRLFYKDWAYIEDNNIIDKKKLKLNFRDTILHYTGIYLIYLGEFKLSLEILKTLFNINNSKLPPTINGEIKIPKESLAAYRLNNIILNLFYLTAIKTYFETNDSKTAYDLLKDCERIFSQHPDSFDHYISLARLAYENGKLDEAIEYTNKAMATKGETIEVLVNLAFFAIIELNINDLAKWHKKIRNKNFNNFNFADVIEFLERQRDKLKSHVVLIDFSVGSFNKLYLDTEYGQQLLTDFIKENESKDEYIPLVQLAKELTQIKKDTIKKGWTQSNLKSKKRRK